MLSSRRCRLAVYQLVEPLLLARQLGCLRDADSERIFALHGEVDRILDALGRKLRPRSGPPA